MVCFILFLFVCFAVVVSICCLYHKQYFRPHYNCREAPSMPRELDWETSRTPPPPPPHPKNKKKKKKKDVQLQRRWVSRHREERRDELTALYRRDRGKVYSRHETSVPERVKDLAARSRAVPHIQGRDQILQGQSHKSSWLAWEFARLESHRESVGCYPGSPSPRECITKTNLTEAIIQVWYLDEKIAEHCRTLVKSMTNRA